MLTVESTVAGVPCIGLNGGPAFRHDEAFSFRIATDDQGEIDRYWNAIVGDGGQGSACGWCKDRWGISWQITPRALTDALAAGGRRRRSEARVRGHDDHEEDRRRRDRGGAARLTLLRASCGRTATRDVRSPPSTVLDGEPRPACAPDASTGFAPAFGSLPRRGRSKARLRR